MPLQIGNTVERRLVSAADLILATGAAVRSAWRRASPSLSPARILLLRLERIGDLLMVLPAIADVRAHAPGAAIDLVVGDWNLELARTIPGVTRVEALSARWLARGATGQGLLALLGEAQRWRARRYDLAINFEPDIRSNMLIAATGASFTAGYASGGGGALLDLALDYDPRDHTTANARRLVAAALGDTGGADTPPLSIPEAARREAARLLARHDGITPLIGVHVSGGRAIKQWPPDRFAEVARRLSETCNATIALTGSREDGAVVQSVASLLDGRPVIDLSGHVDLPTLGAILARLDLLITGDTGPMHLAGAVGTPVVAVFGPSDPVRYAPRGPHDWVVRADLPCSPCNRIRQPPARCVGHTPDCLAAVSVASVFDAAMAALTSSGALTHLHTGRA